MGDLTQNIVNSAILLEHCEEYHNTFQRYHQSLIFCEYAPKEILEASSTLFLHHIRTNKVSQIPTQKMCWLYRTKYTCGHTSPTRPANYAPQSTKDNTLHEETDIIACWELKGALKQVAQGQADWMSLMRSAGVVQGTCKRHSSVDEMVDWIASKAGTTTCSDCEATKLVVTER